MVNVILIDDEVHCLETLGILLQEYCADVQVMEKCRSAQEGLRAIKKNKPDLVFLDIEMPGMNGFEMLEQLPEVSFAVIFTTSYDRYAVKAIHFSALDYLLKPVEPNELVNAVKKVKEQRRLPAAEQIEMLLKQMQHKNFRFTKVAIPTLEGYELIPASDIIRCEAADNYTHLICSLQPRIIACRTLKDMEEQLHPFSFFLRVHHSYIVNLNEVIRYIRGEGGYLVMSDGSTVTVSRSRKDALLRLF